MGLQNAWPPYDPLQAVDRRVKQQDRFYWEKSTGNGNRRSFKLNHNSKKTVTINGEP